MKYDTKTYDMKKQVRLYLEHLGFNIVGFAKTKSGIVFITNNTGVLR